MVIKASRRSKCKIKEGEIENAVVTDTAIWEVYTVLRNRGRIDESDKIYEKLGLKRIPLGGEKV
ncbi:MAG: hypothetical protein ACXQTW_01195 [Candidatus Methanospirareceae archaeon]